MKKFFLILWLIAFCCSSVVASNPYKLVYVYWECIYCGQTNWTRGEYPVDMDNPKCEDQKNCHIWKVESIKVIDPRQKPAQPSKKMELS